MATFVAWDDWWVAILELETVDLGPAPSGSWVRNVGTRYRARLGHRATTVAIVRGEPSPARDQPDELTFEWLRPEAAFAFGASARAWLAALREWAPAASTALARSHFLRMLIEATAQLQRWPGSMYASVPPGSPAPAPGVAWPVAAGALTLDGREHRLTGWVDGRLCYHAPDGREFDVTAAPDLLRTLLAACAAQFTPGDASPA